MTPQGLFLPPSSSNPTADPNASISSEGTSDRPTIPSFELELQVDGSLQPGQSVQLTARITGKRDVRDAEVKIMLPELAALQSARQQGPDAALEWRVNEQLPAELRARRSVGNGDVFTEQVNVTFPEPGYYRAVAMVSDQSDDVTENGRWIDPADGEEIWLWINEKGGYVTERFEEDRFPDDIRIQPGPFVAKDATPRWQVMREGQAVSGPAPNSGSALLNVTYLDPVDGTHKPLPEDRVEVAIYDGYEDRVVGAGTLWTDENGEVLVDCKPNDPVYEVQISIITENGDVVVYEEMASKRTRYLEDPPCGATVPTDTYSNMSHVFNRMNITIDRSEGFFQHSRGKIPVNLSYDEELSFYRPEGWSLLDEPPLYGGDYIVICESDSRFSEDAGNRIIAHEYGHALHDKELGGNEGGCNGKDHYLNGALSLPCAFSEGFAQYHASVTIDGDNTFIPEIEDNVYYPASPENSESGPLDDGSIIEGAVAAFLYDLTDPANEPHDQVDYPGEYVAEIIETCTVSAPLAQRADGIDHLIACFQQSIPNYSIYFPNRDNPPSDFQEGASEPSGWDANAIDLLWKTNLYDEYVPTFTVDISGPSYLDEGEYGTWTASPSGGNGSYSYDWDIRQQPGQSWGSVCSNSSSCTWGSGSIFETLDADIRVTVDSGTESTDAQMGFIVNNNDGGGGGGCDPMLNKLCLQAEGTGDRTLQP